MSLMRAELLAVLGLLVGCSSASSPDAVSDGGGVTSPESGVDAAAPEPPPAPHPTSDALRACARKAGDVRTIADAITRFNNLKVIRVKNIVNDKFSIFAAVICHENAFTSQRSALISP